MAIRAMIVDDEPLARERLRTLLSEQRDIAIVGEAGDATTAVDAIARLSPDVVFLDIQMPGATGFDVINAIGPRHMPAVVFVTAYDKYALKAFEVHALDYLLKPFDRGRFAKTLGHVREQMGRRHAGDLEQRLRAIVGDLRPTGGRAERFVVKSGGRVFFVRAADIDWIEAAGNYVKLHIGNEAHLLRETMHSIEARLDPVTFFRIHRCHIVNMERIREMQPWFNGEYVVFLQNGTRLTLSRGYREKLQERLGKSI